MQKKYAGIIKAVIATVGTITTAVMGYFSVVEPKNKDMENSPVNTESNNTDNNNNITINNNIDRFFPNDSQGKGKSYGEKDMDQMNEENQKLQEKLESVSNELASLKEQKAKEDESAKAEKESIKEENESVKAENEALKTEIEEGKIKIAELQENAEALTNQLNNGTSAIFEDIPIYLEGTKVSTDGDSSVALINGSFYYSEAIVKEMVESWNKIYNFSESQIDVATDTSHLEVSKAEIYEIDNSVSLSSGIRADIGGNEFSGILISGNGRVSFLLNGQYKKIRGIVHVAKESANENKGYINIYKTDKDGNVTPVHESKELTKISGVDDFSNGCDIEGAVIVTIEGTWRYSGEGIDMVISDAYFYND